MGKGGKKHGIGGPPRKKGAAQPARPAQPIQAAVKASQEGQAPVSTPASGVRGLAPRTPLLDSVQISNSLDQVLQDKARMVPMEFRAQAKGRCQRQDRKSPDIQLWIKEWIDGADPKSSFNPQALRVVEVKVDWRLISNSGIDEGFVRPVIGAGGWPMIPGSSIKGLFRRACAAGQLEDWCGSSDAKKPGVLRFHGAWLMDSSWTAKLLDVTHPQQNWQIGFEKGGENHNANAIVSLYKPTLYIGLSSSADLNQYDWVSIEATLRSALDLGLGGRTSAGYGSTGRLSGNIVFQCGLEGEGAASKLLLKTRECPNGIPEFRPTMFRAAIRGMALRLFGGLTDERSARETVGKLFGSLGGDEGQNVGLIATAYADFDTRLGSYGRGGLAQPTYATHGQLQWRMSRQCRDGEDEALLSELIACLHGITMSLGGFGRGWRRPDHQIFFPEYGKMPLGSHWEWREPDQLPSLLRIQSASDLIKLLGQSRKIASHWLEATDCPQGPPATWREVIHPDKMLIWSRYASSTEDAKAIRWFHNPRDGELPRYPWDLRKSKLAGQMNLVGRIWNRLLPLEAGIQERTALHDASASPIARRGAATARPGVATARPGDARARPPVGAMDRPFSAMKSVAPRGEVWMNHSSGPFLESLVLFPELQQSPAFIKAMDGGAGADFQRLTW